MTAKCKHIFMKFRLNYKTISRTVGSVSAITSLGYFGHLLVTKYNVFGKTVTKTIDFDENKDFIVLDNGLTIDSLADNVDNELITGHKSESTRTHFHLLSLAQSITDSMVRQLAISAIARTHFNDYEYRELAQRCDFRTGILLARIPDISSKLFLPPITTNFIKLNNSSDIVFDFEKVLQNLMKTCLNSDHQCSECTQFFTQLSIEMLETGRHSRQIQDSIDFNEIHDLTRHSRRRRRVPEVDWLYLQAITQNILCGKTQVQALVDNGLFLVLHYLRHNFSDPEVQDWIGQTLANLSAHKETHLHFWNTRWFGVLVEWLQSNRLESSLLSAKILYNLSEGSDQNLLSESMYLLHPIFEDKSDKHFDIVLVHGLLGGVVKTWRQCDTEKQLKDYTRCWPKDWLARDVPDIRVLAVNYQTFLSNWKIECQDNNNVFSLKQRSSQLLNDLIKSKVGQKPIVWITHSMGGLLVKQMLVDVNDSNDPKLKPILNQTKGIVFYSVPHSGTDMAVWSPYLQPIMSPSSEILQLRKDSKLLHSLHKRFVELLENKSIDCLSYGETLKSTVIKRPFKWSYLLVPKDSSDPGVGEYYLLDVDHFNSCKPKHKTSESYERTVGFIKRIIELNRVIKDEKCDKMSVLLSSLFN